MRRREDVLSWVAGAIDENLTDPAPRKRVATIEAPGVRENEFALVLKPELFVGGADIAAVLGDLAVVIAGAGVQVSRVAVCSGPWIAAQRTMAIQYPILRRVARYGVGALSESARFRLERLMPGGTGYPLGGYQALEAYELSVDALEAAVRSAETFKLGTGAYLTLATLRDRPIPVLNGFHPRQVEHFQGRAASVVAFHCHAARPWRELSDLVGPTDPQRAPRASLRGYIHARHAGYRLPKPTIATNCLHVSPGPIDAMFLLAHLFGARGNLEEDLERTSCGERLRARGFGRPLAALAGLEERGADGRKTSIQELTEWLDTDPGVELIARLGSSG